MSTVTRPPPIGGDQPPAQGLDHGAGRAQFVHQQPGDARAVAAAPRPGAVGVEDAHEDVAAARGRPGPEAGRSRSPGGGRRWRAPLRRASRQGRESGRRARRNRCRARILREWRRHGGVYRPCVPDGEVACRPSGLACPPVSWRSRRRPRWRAPTPLLAVGDGAAWPTRAARLPENSTRGPRRQPRRRRTCSSAREQGMRA